MDCKYIGTEYPSARFFFLATSQNITLFWYVTEFNNVVQERFSSIFRVEKRRMRGVSSTLKM